MRAFTLIAVFFLIALASRIGFAAPPSGLTDGFRAFRWGSEATKSMLKIARKANMDVYVLPDSDKNVAGVKALEIYYLYYGGGLCRVEVKWFSLNDEQHNRIRTAVSEQWGTPKTATEHPGLFSADWVSSNGITRSHLSSLDPVSTPERDWMTTLIVEQVACSSSAIEGRGL